MIEHPSDDQLRAYCMDTLDPITAEGLELHVFDCELCGNRLEEQARIELAMDEVAAAPVLAVAPAPPLERSPSPPARVSRWVVAGLAMAAALLLVARIAVPPTPEPVRTAHRAELPPCDSLASCVHEAHNAGLAMTQPELEIPIYEDLQPGMTAGVLQ